MAKIVIDGVDIEAKDGQTVMEAAKGAGVDIPHFCYHSRLKVAGNCRMCLVEIEKVPKLQIACGTPVRDGMVVTTQNDRVKKARMAVLEFLLINHPLDCPVCDQCGECKLQDYCFEYGKAKSRFSEQKHTFERLDIGPNIHRNQNRCIHCTRCIRFLRDVAGSEEAALTERGGHTVVGPYFNKAVESDFSINAADVCPVGALTSKHFRFRGRSWLMEKARTVCTDCSRGCNVTAWSYKGELLRLTPEDNDYVNLQWICDAGRLSVNNVNSDTRIAKSKVDGKEVPRSVAMETVAGKLKTLVEAGDGSKIAVLGSGKLTNEDNFALAALSKDVLIGSKPFLISPPEDDREFDPVRKPLTQWFIRNDKNPNTVGAKQMIPGAADATELVNAIDAGDIDAVLVFGADPAKAVEGAAEALKKVGLLVVLDTHSTKTSEMANVVLPEACSFEKDGTVTNEGSRVQKISKAIAAPGGCVSTLQTVADLAAAMGADWKIPVSVGDVFEKITLNVADYSGLSFAMLPVNGVYIGPEKTPDDGQNEVAEDNEPEKAG